MDDVTRERSTRKLCACALCLFGDLIPVSKFSNFVASGATEICFRNFCPLLEFVALADVVDVYRLIATLTPATWTRPRSAPSFSKCACAVAHRGRNERQIFPPKVSLCFAVVCVSHDVA